MDTSRVAGARPRVGSPPGCFSHPALRACKLTSPLGQRKAPGTRSSRWTWCPGTESHHGPGDLDSSGSDSRGGGETQPESRDSGRVPIAFECPSATSPPRPRCHFSFCPEDSALYPGRSPNSDIEPEFDQRVWGQATAIRSSGPRQSSCKWTSLSQGRGPHLGPTEVKSRFLKLLPGEVCGIH